MGRGKSFQPISTASQEVPMVARIKNEFITVTPQEANVILNDGIEGLRAKRSWELPAQFATNLLLILIATKEFNSYTFLSADMIKACVIVGLAVSTFSLVRSTVKAIKAKDITPRSIVKDLQNCETVKMQAPNVKDDVGDA